MNEKAKKENQEKQESQSEILDFDFLEDDIDLEDFEVARSENDFWFACVDIKVLHDTQIKNTTRLIYALYCSFASPYKNRACWPSNETIANLAGVSLETVKRANKELIDLGIIHRIERKNHGKKKQLTSTTILIGYHAIRYGGDGEIFSPFFTEKSAELFEKSLAGTDGEKYGYSIKQFQGCHQKPRNNKLKESISTIRNLNIPYREQVQNKNSKNQDSFKSHRILSQDLALSQSNTLQHESNLGPREKATLKEQKDFKEQKLFEGTQVIPPENAPAILIPTARYLLQRTGRNGLTEKELEALKKFKNKHTPARIQKEIDIAFDRFLRLKRDITGLNFEYIFESLKHQKSFSPKSRAEIYGAKNENDSKQIKEFNNAINFKQAKSEQEFNQADFDLIMQEIKSSE